MVPGKPFCWHSLLDYHIGHWRKINWRAAWNTPILQCLPHPLNFLNSSLQQCLLRVAKVLVSSVNSGSLVLPLQPSDTESSWGSRSTISRYSPWLDLKRICTSAFRNRTHILTHVLGFWQFASPHVTTQNQPTLHATSVLPQQPLFYTGLTTKQMIAGHFGQQEQKLGAAWTLSQITSAISRLLSWRDSIAS